ncbi:glycine zipper 2TM domain-containing protein [Xanthomonas massiliensis]|uniref:glycine zipper 2TM domain-containing protein n=1 Tax=Xanthomonas massiliensis TaxID=1720302 RepID=UPI0008263066|nr:glycine zipper 2TM domain-containing protein [Xanthomonas massiliensis]
MKNNTTIALVAVGALLVGGIATAAFMNNRKDEPAFVAPPAAQADTPAAAADDAPAADTAVATPAAALQYADVTKVVPVTEKERVYGTVVSADPISKTTTTTTPHEVCKDMVVQERLPERDGNVGGTVVGAVVGGLLGNQVGKGGGRKAATVAGAVVGGVIGNRVDNNHVGGKVVDRTERQCHTEQASSQSTAVTGYKVTYRKPDGSTATTTLADKPGERIDLGNQDKVVGYDVTYRLDGQDKQVRMAHKPDGERLPVVDGKLVTQTASLDPATR